MIPVSLKRFLTPPRFVNQEKTRAAGLLYTIELVLLAACLMGIIAGIFFARFSMAAASIACLLINLLGMSITRWGHINLAAMIITLMLLFSMTLVAYNAEGIHSHAILTFSIVIVISSFILERRFFILNTGLAVLAAGFLTFAEMNGLITTPFSAEVSLYDFTAVSIILVVTAAFTRQTANYLQDSLTRANKNEQALMAANQELAQQKRASQQRENESQVFLQKLQALYQISLELSRTKSLPALYQQAVELGQTELGFDRLGILLYDARNEEIVGTFGVDADGRIVDESFFHGHPLPFMLEVLANKSPIVIREDAPLYFAGQQVGHGWNVLTVLWDGNQSVGWLSADNLLTRRPLSPFQPEILTLYAATLGHLITRIQTEEALRANEAEARHFQERLHALHEVSIALAGTDSLETLYRQSIELGRQRLGFDRLGLLLYDEEANLMLGTFGTDEYGRLRDERYFKQKIEAPHILEILQSQKRLGFWENTDIIDDGQAIGRGWNAMSVLWNGTRGIGWLSADNFIKREAATSFQLEVLTLYGGVLGHLVTLKRREETLRTYALELERSNKELELFAYAASHDLQEPLRKVLAFGDRLAVNYANKLDERGLDYLHRMQDATARMQQLIQDLLTLSRVQTRGAPFTAVDLTEIINGVMSDMETYITEVNAGFQLGVLPVVHADSTQMRQLFQNLLSNALKFHRPQESPLITIHCEPFIDDVTNRSMCRLYVRDNGIGFEPQYADRIFGMFQRLHGRDKYDGSGIGLAICKRIVERHNGQILAQGIPNEGATFIITLPLGQE